MREYSEATMNTAYQIMDIDNAIWARRGITSRPWDEAEYLQLLEETREAIAERPELVGRITPDVLDILTEYNYHTARKAAELVTSGDR